ncbi:Uma2 family endonuclease [Chroococcidiopsis sp. CCNUC1]|uniref:Uma2 family endonuclease n=1 Tax=Chroococcidiopsis sp. CCNUC1 TaxID=2653189 RepID=UPI002021805C|nr:Uma2 family endonuclease [Chroococcidiopsis sp. CCNUC1]URD48371.1 Uma2 family endonuclease [Chroococcidiopsis sp. CCNUC1]
MTAITLNLEPAIHLTDEQFYQLCQANRDVRFERTAEGELIVMPPTGGETGDRNSEMNFQLRAWNKQTRLGKVFDSSTGFKLPNGADRSPDAAWVRLEQWEALTPEQRQKFPPLAPDFVIELRSATDDLKPLQAKMQEYLDNGVLLGWLLDPQRQIVEIYRIGIDVEVIQSPTTLSGEDVLPGFVMDLSEIF